MPQGAHWLNFCLGRSCSRWMRLWLPLVMLLVAGCAAAPATECGGTYHLHASMKAEDVAPVRAAFAKWNALAGHEVARLEEGDPDDTTCSVRLDETTGDHLGLWSHSDGSIALSPERMRTSAPRCYAAMDDCVEATMMHELGHGLGLGHVPEAPAVMASEGMLVLEFRDADLAECARAGVCSPAR